MAMSQTSTVLRRLPLVLLATAVSVGYAQTRSPSQFAADTIRQTATGPGSPVEVKVVLRQGPELRELVSRHLDAALVRQAQAISGRDYRYQFADPELNRHLGTIVLRYSSAAVARQMAGVLAPRQGYFRNTKILIHFSAIPLGALLLIVYSENSGDDCIVQALDKLPATFQKAAGPGAPAWSESE
jgi:hypothetical protein